MPKRIYLYETAEGREVVANQLRAIARSQKQAFRAIRTGFEMLEEFGADPGTARFTRLKHVDGGTELWELRTNSRPAYRVLFAPVPGEEVFVILHVVLKTDMEARKEATLRVATDALAHWLAEVHSREDES